MSILRATPAQDTDGTKGDDAERGTSGVVRSVAQCPGADSRAGHDPRFLRPADVTDTVLAKARALNQIAQARGQTLAQLALAWVLRHPVVTTAIIGASKVKQIEDCVAAAGTVAFSADEQVRIDRILA